MPFVDPYGLAGRGGLRWGPGRPSIQPHSTHPHGPYNHHTHHQWYNQNPKNVARHLGKGKVIRGAGRISRTAARLRAGVNAWGTHPVAGPATMGAGAAAITYLAFKNVEQRYLNKAAEINLRLDGENQKAISNYWGRRMGLFVDEQLSGHIRKECCEKTKLSECINRFKNGLGLRNISSGIAIDCWHRSGKKGHSGPENPEQMLQYMRQH